MYLSGLTKNIVKLILISPYYLIPDVLQIYIALKKSFIKGDFFQMTKEKKVSSFSIFFLNINRIFPFRNKLFSHCILSHFKQAPCWKALISHFPNTCNNSSVYWSQQGSLIRLTYLSCMKRPMPVYANWEKPPTGVDSGKPLTSQSQDLQMLCISHREST